MLGSQIPLEADSPCTVPHIISTILPGVIAISDSSGVYIFFSGLCLFEVVFLLFAGLLFSGCTSCLGFGVLGLFDLPVPLLSDFLCFFAFFIGLLSALLPLLVFLFFLLLWCFYC